MEENPTAEAVETPVVTAELVDEEVTRKRIFVEARVREIVSSAGTSGKSMKVSQDFLTELNYEFERIVMEAAKRALENGRSTLKAQDV